jgi:hypothetical protein
MARFGQAASAAALLVALATSSSGQAQSVQTDYTYDVYGRLAKAARTGTTTDYTYDNAHNRARVKTTAANNTPVANPDALSVTAGFGQGINPLANDTDADSDNFFLTGASASAQNKGTVTPVINCIRTAATCVTYVANGNASGLDSFTYTISDGNGGTATGAVNVTINATGIAPVAQPFSVTITPNSAGNVAGHSLPLSFTGGTPTSVNILSAPGSGSASVSGASILYSSSAWTGQTSLQYTGTNGAGTGAAATVTLNVKPVVTDAASLTATPGQAKTVSLSPYAVTTSGITSMSLPNGPNTQKGMASISGTTLTYTPTAGQTGTDTFAYVANSAGGTSAAANITFNIQSCPAPVAGSSSATVAYNSASNVIPLNVSGSVSSVNYVSGTSHGSVQPVGATMYYTPFTGYSGSDSFTYNATNACGTSNTATATITVTGSPNNQPPVANERWNSLNQSASVTLDPRDGDSDPNNDLLTVAGLGSFYFAYGRLNGVDITSTSPQAPTNIGSRSFTGTSMTFNAPFVSNTAGDFFVIVAWYTVSDGHGGTAQGDEIFVVNAVPSANHAPQTAPDYLTISQGDIVYVNVVGNDTDADGNALTVTGISAINTPKAAYQIVGNEILVGANSANGSEAITYTISDGAGGTATGTLYVNFTN